MLGLNKCLKCRQASAAGIFDRCIIIDAPIHTDNIHHLPIQATIHVIKHDIPIPERIFVETRDISQIPKIISKEA